MKIQPHSDQLSPEMTIDVSANKNRHMEKETFPTQLYRHIKVEPSQFPCIIEVIKTEYLWWHKGGTHAHTHT